MTSAPGRETRAGALELWAGRAPLFIAVYYGLQLAVRLLLSPNLEVDDAEMVGQVQWAWGYANSHPPLYSWLVRICHDAFGDWPAATAVPKYGLLAAGALLVYDAVRRASGSRLTAALAVVALILIPQVAWKTQAKLSHSVLGFAATAATVHAAGLVLAKGRWRDFAWLGAAISMGVLSKYNYLFVLAGLAVAVGFAPAARHAFLRPRALLSLALVLVLTGPHLVWLKTHMGDATERLYMLRTPERGAQTGGGFPLDGLASLAEALALSIGPPLLAWIVAGRLFRPAAGAPHETVADDGGMRRLALIVFGASIAGFALAAMLGGFHKVHERYLLALLPAFAVWLALAWPMTARPGAARGLLWLGLAVAVGVTVARPVVVHLSDNRLAYPYGQFAAMLLPSAPQYAAVLGDRPENSGNLAMNLPAGQVFDPAAPSATVLAVADNAPGIAGLERGLGAAYQPGQRQIICGMLSNQVRKRVCLTAEVLTRRPAAAAFPTGAQSANPARSGPALAAGVGSR